jgi:hypothetical protein
MHLQQHTQHVHDPPQWLEFVGEAWMMPFQQCQDPSLGGRLFALFERQ